MLEKTFSAYKGHTNSNYFEIASHPSQNDDQKKLLTATGKDVRIEKLLHFTAWNANL